MTWIVKELKPWIDGNYRTWPHREANAIAGYSMGGMMTLFTILRYNDSPRCFQPWMRSGSGRRKRMCELFGVSANRKVTGNEQLQEFFSHS